MNVINRFRGKKRSAREAKERLSNLLALDRAQISPGKLHHFQQDVARAVQQHFGVNPEHVEVEIEGRGRNVQLNTRVSLRRTAA